MLNKNDILVVYGSDPAAMTRRLLETIKPEEYLPKTAKIGLKPNLVVAKSPDTGATTHPQIAEEIIKYFQARGYENIVIIESAWIGDSTQRGFKVCGYDKMSAKYGVELVDVKRDSYISKNVNGMDIEVSKRMMDLDYLISLPVLKGHCQTSMTCALKNMKGLISDRSKRYFHTIGLHRPIAALNSIRCADLVIVDSINGDLDFEEGGNPVQSNRMLAGTDSVLIDSYGAELMGFDRREVAYIDMAAKLGVGNPDTAAANIVELNEAAGASAPVSGRKAKSLEGYVTQSSACSACYASVIHALARMQERGELRRLKDKLYIGQDFKGKSCDGIGIGQCTCGFERYVKGCPPKAIDIINYLSSGR